MVSIESKLVYADNDTYYLKFGNGILDSTFTQIHIPADSYIINDNDTTNDWIQFRNDELYINYANVDLKSGTKLRNDSFSADNWIQFNNNYLLINFPEIVIETSSKFVDENDVAHTYGFDSAGLVFDTPVKINSPYAIPLPTRYPLEVTGYFTAPDTTGSALYYQDVPSLGGRAIAINGDVNMSAKFEYGLYVETGQEIWVASDERIKKDIEPFNNGLNLLRQLEVKSYRYIDGRGKEPKHVEIGFIAQEVKEIYPKAVNLNQEYIPNVYKQINVEWSDFDGKFKMKTNDLPEIVDIDYRFFCWNECDIIETKVEAKGNSDNTFTFDKKWENVFCIGNKINDFNTLDKSSLYVINFSATKELDQIVKQQQEEIDDLKKELTEMKTIINKLVSAKSFKEFKS